MTARGAAAVVGAAIALGAGSASAEPFAGPGTVVERAAAPSGPTELVATQPLAWVARGVAVGYEHLVVPRTSVVALVGLSSAAQGDFSSLTVSAGAEVRYWPNADAARTMRGVFFGLHVSAGRTRLTDDTMGEAIGTQWTLTERVDVGYRWVAWRRVAITPSAGVAAREDIAGSGRLATTVRPVLTIGLELGWMF